jgi:hypothetical protein
MAASPTAASPTASPERPVRRPLCHPHQPADGDDDRIDTAEGPQEPSAARVGLPIAEVDPSTTPASSGNSAKPGHQFCPRTRSRRSRTGPLRSWQADIADAAKHKRGRRRSDEGVPGFRGLTDHLATMTLNLVVSPQAPNAIITLAYTVPERGARIARRHPHHKSGASETRREADEAGATATILTITSGTTQENISVECAIEPHLLLLTPGAH